MEESHFKIFSASAGSGKTYALAKEYLKLLLTHDSPLKFRQILAITFTNKAVNEMKTRILDNLHAFGQKEIPEKQEPLFKELCQKLSLSGDQLQQKSKVVLKRILHNYSFFEISTIDKFNHKIIKTFARDLHLSQNFEVELDTELLLEEAVGRMLERAGNDQALTEVLLAFSLEKIDENKSWNIAYDLVEIGKLLFQENHSAHIEPLRSKSIEDFKEIQKNIISKIRSIETSVVEMAQKALVEITEQGFDFVDFPRQTLPNHFKKISDKEFNPKNLYNNKLEQNLAEGKILKANDKRDVNELTMTLLNAFLSIKQEVYQRSYLKNIYGNLVPLTVLNEISKEIKNIGTEKEIIPISSLNTILSNQIKDQPVPFIYERMGEKYRHYFIDEFQDTSKMQWENLIPLIGNALEGENLNNEQGSLFLVGDVKQAIYRWRGGRAKQFLNLLNGKLNPFVVKPNILSLDTNWRSHDQIVEFNNDFFSAVASVLKNEDYKNLFLKDSRQKTNNKPGGFVQMSFLEKNILEKETVYCNQVLDTIQKIISKNYTYSDISVLIRDNTKGMLVADFLAQNDIPIISSDVLLLANNPQVSFLIALLKIIENANDREAAYHVLLYLAKEKMDKHEFIFENIDNIQDFLNSQYGFHIQSIKGQSVFNILESAIVHFDLVNRSDAYLTFLMDEVLHVERKEGPSTHSFLNYWEIKKTSLSISAPENINAVKIMTVHKAKGLEFPFVIFPFANAKLNKMSKKSWVPAVQNEHDLGFDEFLINTNKEMLIYNQATSNIYSDEEQKTILDAMNVLYVALTRPIKGLYIIAEKGKEVTSINQATSYSDLFQYYLYHLNIPISEQDIHFFGSFPENEIASEEKPLQTDYIPYITRPKGNTGFLISTTSGRLWDDERREAIEIGNLIHFALSQIKVAEDVPQVIETMQLSGLLEGDAVDEIEQKLVAVVNHPKLQLYFSDLYEIMNEREILTISGASLRPDRVVIAGNEATIIDYKTGNPSPSHQSQIKHYGTVLKGMGFKIKQCIIVYIDQKINPVFA